MACGIAGKRPSAPEVRPRAPGTSDPHHTIFAMRPVSGGQTSWSLSELRAELIRFESELRAAGLRENSIRTYVDRSTTFLRWLAGEYVPGDGTESTPPGAA